MVTDIINRLKGELATSFGDLNNWFCVSEDLLNYQPANGWTIANILEHISLTNHFLLILIRKGAEKSIHLSKGIDFSALLSNYKLDSERLRMISEHKSFEWNRPSHMEPCGEITLSEVKDKLDKQLKESINYLEQLQDGQGVLYKTTMTVGGLGKIDVYHYIYFLIQHIKRHITQIKNVQSEFDKAD